MFYKRNILLFVLVQVSLLADVADINETKIFLDKHQTGINAYKQEALMNRDTNISVSQINRDINISDKVKDDVANLYKNRLTDKAMQEQAQRDSEIVNTQKFKKQFQEAKDHLLYDKKLNWSDQAAVAQKHIQSQKENGEGNFYFNSKETIYIFVSSSMPKETIIAYLETTKYVQNNVVFVLQGAIGGLKKLRPTMQWIKDLIGEKYSNARFIIEPRLAKNYGIKRVPAILYTEKNLFELEAENISSRANNTLGDTYIFYGDMPIRYVLRSLNSEKENAFLESLLLKLDTK